MEGRRGDWKQVKRRSGFLKQAVSCAICCIIMAALALGRLLRGELVPEKALELLPVLFILFAGLPALSFYRWKHCEDDC